MNAMTVIPGRSRQLENGDILWVVAEGGFKDKDRVRIELNGDSWDGKGGVITMVTSERTCMVTIGKDMRRYCVDAIRPI